MSRATEIARRMLLFHTGEGQEREPAEGWRSAALEALAAGTPDEEDLRTAVARLEGEALPAAAEAELRTVAGLLGLAARFRVDRRRDAFLVRIRGLARRIRDRLTTEQRKTDAAQPAALSGSMGPAVGVRLDVQALSQMIGTRRETSRLPEEARRRLEAAAELLASFSFANDEPRVRIVASPSLDVSPAAGVAVETADDPLTAALELHEREAARLTDVLRAAHLAELVLDNAFDPDRQEAWLESFGPDSFRPSERLLVPAVVALDAGSRVRADALPALSKTLVSNVPVQVVLVEEPSAAFGAASRVEISYLAMGHRRAFVQQSSMESPAHLLEGFLGALDHAQPAVHVVDGTESSAGATLSRAALITRAHPRFRFDPAAGGSWASRFDLDGNPEPESAWPSMDLGEDAGTVAVTYADGLVGRADFSEDFRVVPEGCPEDALSPLAEWLDLDPAEARFRIPWVWALDPDGKVGRLAMTRRVVNLCRERRDFWHTLQELGGVSNEYVTDAVRRTREELSADAAAVVDRLQVQHASELSSARKDAVEGAMQSLARRLLELDPSTPPASAVAPAPASSEGPAPEAAAPPPAAVEPEPAVEAPPASTNGSDEAWIDTPLCTSCDECTKLNARMFVYDENKQATIADVTAGSYREMVQAAEKCPARCIHPGDPWNSEESGLEELVRRAEPFR